MSGTNLSQNLKKLRQQKGLSQESLAENSGLSLRTIQRIENNESEPRGDSLQRLAEALGATPDDLFEWKITEDKSFLIFLALSPLSFLLFPILGIILPLTLWILKRNQIKDVDRLGKAILNFEITLCLVFFAYLLAIFSGLLGVFGTISAPVILVTYGPIVMLYLYNIVLIVWNSVRISKGGRFTYFPSIPFLR
jgi:transcriptional regulator with XRE-family HTH domain